MHIMHDMHDSQSDLDHLGLRQEIKIKISLWRNVACMLQILNHASPRVLALLSSQAVPVPQIGIPASDMTSFCGMHQRLIWLGLLQIYEGRAWDFYFEHGGLTWQNVTTMGVTRRISTVFSGKAHMTSFLISTVRLNSVVVDVCAAR